MAKSWLFLHQFLHQNVTILPLEKQDVFMDVNAILVSW